MSAAIPDDVTCEELVELVTDYLEDKLAVEARTSLELHLTWCPGCMVYLRQMRDLTRAARTLKARNAPAPPKAALLDAFRRLKAAGEGGAGR